MQAWLWKVHIIIKSHLRLRPNIHHGPGHICCVVTEMKPITKFHSSAVAEKCRQQKSEAFYAGNRPCICVLVNAPRRICFCGRISIALLADLAQKARAAVIYGVDNTARNLRILLERSRRELE